MDAMFSGCLHEISLTRDKNLLHMVLYSFRHFDSGGDSAHTPKWRFTKKPHCCRLLFYL